MLRPSKTEATEGDSIQFEVIETTDDDHWITDLKWDFGDGETAEGWWALHSYGSAGTYTVALTATDNTGESTTHEVEITVE